MLTKLVLSENECLARKLQSLFYSAIKIHIECVQSLIQTKQYSSWFHRLAHFWLENESVKWACLVLMKLNLACLEGHVAHSVSSDVCLWWRKSRILQPNKPYKINYSLNPCQKVCLIIYSILDHLVLVSSADSWNTYRKWSDLRILRNEWPQNAIKSYFFLTAICLWFMYSSLCQYLGNTFPSFVVLFSVHTMCSFAAMTPFFQSIFSFYFLTELLRHSSDKWQFPQQGAGVSSISPWDQRNSLPWGFLLEMFHNRSRSEHVQTQAAVRFVENWLDYSQPATTSMPAASFSVFGGRRATSCYLPPVFFWFWYSQGSHRWLAWCVIVGVY